MNELKVIVDGAVVTGLEVGSGSEAIVLMHGGTPGASPYLPSSLLWEPLVEHLSGDMPRVVAIDLPGTGATSVAGKESLRLSAIGELVRRALPALGITRALMVGHGQASLVALKLARECVGTEIAGAAVIAGSGAAPTSDGVINRTLESPPTLHWSAASQRWALSRLSFDTCHISATLIHSLVLEARQVGPSRAASMLAASDCASEIAADRLGAKLELFAFARDHGYEVPITIVWGANDPLLSVAHGDGTFEVLSTTKAHLDFTVIARAGHLPHRDRPAEVADQLRRLYALA